MRGRETAVKVYHPSGCICKHCKYGHVSYRPLEDMGRLKKKKVLNKVPLCSSSCRTRSLQFCFPNNVHEFIFF